MTIGQKWWYFRYKIMGRCNHKHHRFGYRNCWKGWVYGGYCAEHNRTCYAECASS